MAAAATATISSSQMVLCRKNHEPLLIIVIIARLNGYRLSRLLFPIHEFIAMARCCLLAGLDLLHYFQSTNL